MTIELFFLFIASGVMAGLLAGLMGIGGGLVVVPALLYIFEHQALIEPAYEMHVAVASSMAIMILTTQAAVRAHVKMSAVSLALFGRLWPGLLLGTVVGVSLSNWIATAHLKLFFAGFLVFVAYKMWRAGDETVDHTFPRPWLHHVIMGLIGANSGLLGVGGGSLIIPYLKHCGVEVRTIAPLTALCTFWVAIIGSLMFALTTHHVTNMPAYSTGFIYWPAVIGVAIPSMIFAPLGAKWMYRLPVRRLRQGFIVLLLMIALDLIYKGV